MPYITEIHADDAYNAAVQNFAVACDANKVALGLSVPDLAEIAGAAVAFGTTMSNLIAAKNAAESAREAKDVQKAATKAIVSKWAKTFRANMALPDALLVDLMVAPHLTPGAKTPPAIPLDLVAASDGQGNIRLQWKRNGNIQGTSFLVEFQSSPGGEWQYLSSVSKRTFFTTWEPGAYVAYRVTAIRRGIASAPGIPVVLWLGGSEVALKLAA